jgi:beta-lactam-binding protein with PASTA domain
MVTVALISAFIAMRLAIHGREVAVPALTGLTIADAARLISHDGLNLTLENRFYSADIPAGRVLAQSPAPGLSVRRDWTVRITESLGAQRVSIPDLEGKSERTATISIRRLSLEPGVIAHLPSAGDADVVIAQSPAANSGSVTGPRVSLLISDPAAVADRRSYVMPSLVGLSANGAAARVASMGLRAVNASPSDSADAAAGQQALPASGVVAAQSPAPGRRVFPGELAHLVIDRSEGIPALKPPAAAPSQ